MGDFGKRELNKAQTRLNLLEAVYRLSETISFKELKVKTLAEASAITEMTFFNYFQKKEDILNYMMGIWAVDLAALQLRQPLQGKAAIRRLFSHTAQQVEAHPRLMAHFVASLLTRDIDPQGLQIEASDRYLRYPELPQLQSATIPSGNEMLLQHLAEIDAEKGLNRDPMPILLQLASCFYGDMIVAHTAGLALDELYRRSLDRIFQSCGQL